MSGSTTAPPSPARAATGPRVQDLKPGRILVVEDNPDILRACQRILSSQGHQVTTATDGEEALVRASADHPDVVLLDVMIPKIDGLEVCRRLKADPDLSGLMVIHVTGRGSVDNRVEGFDAGADDYIPKPFHVPELLARVRSALRIKRLTDDLAERNRQLQKSQADLIQSEKMATIGLLASGIAHEFNNIMAGISGYAQLAKRSPKYQESLVEVALVQTERALEITRSLSSYNRKSQGYAAADVAKVIESALCLVVKEMERTGVEIERRFRENAEVAISPGQLQEVVLNLVLNAIQAIEHDRGKITVDLDGTPDGRGVVIAISDNGSGIAPENLTRIFDPFFTTKGALGSGRQPGTGLGLTVSYNIVQGAGGKIEVESAPGKGTKFRLTLPRASDGGKTPAPSAGPPTQLQVLVLDAEDSLRDVLQEALAGHAVHISATPEAALAAAVENRFDFALITLESGDRAPGFALLEALLERHPEIRVIAASSTLPGEAHVELLRRAHGHLLRPFKRETLRTLLGLPEADPPASCGGGTRPQVSAGPGSPPGADLALPGPQTLGSRS